MKSKRLTFWVLLVVALLVFLALSATALLVDEIEQQNAQAAADAYVKGCQQREPLLMTIDGETWDLNACG